MFKRFKWERAKEAPQHYGTRSPKASVLYQIVHDFRGNLQPTVTPG
jgi:hypothetical protein